MPDIPAEARQFRILVTGSRSWTDYETLDKAIRDAIPELAAALEVIVVHGACPKGADALASRWCEDNAWWLEHGGVTLIEEPHPADWDRLGKRAGFARNAWMVQLRADLCLAFIVDGSRGASYTADLAEKAGIPVRRYERNTDA